MLASDRICLFLAEGTEFYDQLVELVGHPSSATPSPTPKPSLPVVELDPATEYVNGIDLESTATSFQSRLQIYGDKPISTFSILA